MSVVITIGLLVLLYIWGILTGIDYQRKKDTNDMLKFSTNVQRLLDENEFLEKQIEHLKAQLPEDASFLI